MKGVNTAATLWCAGAVGTFAGAGFPFEMIAGTVAVLAVHLGLDPVVRWVDAHTKTTRDVETYYRLRVRCADGEGSHIGAILMRHISGHPRMSVLGISTEESENEGRVIVADVYASERNDRALEQIVAPFQDRTQSYGSELATDDGIRRLPKN